MTPRDVAAVTWLADQKVMYEPDLGVLLARLGGREKALQAAGIRSWLRRMESAGVVRAERLFVGRPRYIVATAEGARLAGQRGWTAPSWTTTDHTAQVARVRLWTELEHPDWEWTSEGTYRSQHAQAITAGKSSGVPDGVVRTPNGDYAVEVELSDKGLTRTARIAARRAARWDGVIYAVRADEQVMRTVRTALAAALEEIRDKGGTPKQVFLLGVPELMEVRNDAA